MPSEGGERGAGGARRGDAALHSAGQAGRECLHRELQCKLRDECLNSHVFGSVAEAQQVLDAWREDYNLVRPHSSLQDRTPAAMGAMWVDSREPRESTAANEDLIEPKIAGRFVTISPS